MKSGQLTSPPLAKNPARITVGSVWGASDVLIGCVSVALEVLVVSVALEVVVTGASVSCGLVEEEGRTEDGDPDVVQFVMEEESLVLLPQEIRRIKTKQSIKNNASFFI